MDVFVEVPLAGGIGAGKAVVGHREHIAVRTAVGRVPITAGVLRAGLVEAFDGVAFAAETPVEAEALAEFPFVTEEDCDLAGEGLVAGVADAEGGEALGVGEEHGLAFETGDGGEDGGRRAGGGVRGGGGNPREGERLRLLDERRSGATAARLAVRDAGVTEVTAGGERVATPLFRDGEILHDFVDVFVGDAAGVGPQRVREDLVVGEIREAQDESGIGERVGGDGEGAVGGDLGEDGAGRAIGETVEAGRDATVDSGTAAAELNRHGAVEIRPIDRTRGDAGAGIPVGPIAGEFHVVVDGPAVAELVFPLGADVALA